MQNISISPDPKLFFLCEEVAPWKTERKLRLNMLAEKNKRDCKRKKETDFSMNEKILILSEMRKLQNISQDEIAKNLGVNRSGIARVEAGIPALSFEYITQMCDMLSIDADFLQNKSNYPFIPGAFIKFHVKGLSARVRPLAWLDLLLKYTDKINILLLLQEKKGNVDAVCAKDDKGSIFLVSINAPLTWKTLFDYTNKYPANSGKIYIATNCFFPTPNELGFYKSFADIEKMGRENIENLIDKTFADVLSDEERKLIELIRKKKIPIDTKAGFNGQSGLLNRDDIFEHIIRKGEKHTCLEIEKIFDFLRRLQGYTQEDIAERLNIDRSAIAHFEAGRYPLAASTISSIAEELGLNPSYFEGTSKELFAKRDDIIYLFLVGKNFKADLTAIEKFLNLKSDIVQIIALRLSITDIGFIRRKRMNAVYAICMRDMQDNLYLFTHRNADYCLGDISRIGEYMRSIGYRFTGDVYVSLDLLGHIKSRTAERDWIDKIIRLRFSDGMLRKTKRR